jgi:hypothetical protein
MALEELSMSSQFICAKTKKDALYLVPLPCRTLPFRRVITFQVFQHHHETNYLILIFYRNSVDLAG